VHRRAYSTARATSTRRSTDALDLEHVGIPPRLVRAVRHQVEDGLTRLVEIERNVEFSSHGETLYASFGVGPVGYAPRMEDETQDPTSDTPADDDEFDPDEIENDPAHEPDEEGLKDLKGG
jgi:hypothetical protein